MPVPRWIAVAAVAMLVAGCGSTTNHVSAKVNQRPTARLTSQERWQVFEGASFPRSRVAVTNQGCDLSAPGDCRALAGDLEAAIRAAAFAFYEQSQCAQSVDCAIQFPHWQSVTIDEYAQFNTPTAPSPAILFRAAYAPVTKQQLMLFGRFVSYVGPMVALATYDHPGQNGVWTVFEAGGSKQQSVFAGSPAVLSFVRMVAVPRITTSGQVSLKWIWTLQLVFGGGMLSGVPSGGNVCSGQSLQAFADSCQALFSQFADHYQGTSQKQSGMPAQR